MQTEVLAEGLRFPECPRWHGGKLWVGDLFGHRVVEVDLQGNVRTVADLTGDLPTGMAWTPDGQLLIVSALARRILRLENNRLIEFADLSKLVEYPLNDMVVDAQGRIYVGNLGYDFGNPEVTPQLAPLLLVTPDGNARIVAEGLAFPNGMVITPDGRTLIVAESHAACLTAFDIEPDGSLSGKRTWAKFEDEGEQMVAPDGICFDAESAVWLASISTREMIRVREGGEITHRILLDRLPIACMLGGGDRRTLFIATSKSFDPSDTEQSGRIETLAVDVPGAGLP
jgi:sugar lactone lactonase YvrE